MAEKQAENEHRHEGLKNRPGCPNRRLLVTNLDVPPDEEVQQLTELLQFAKIEVEPS